MDKCIHPSCSCKAYKEPKGAKGTLLQLRTGCQECGHQASLHRKLTSIDRYIQDEVKKAKKFKQCRHRILTREIPRSPLFEPYDLIPLPSEDQCTSENHEGGVQCTCKGFETDLARLWQKFRTHNLDYVRTELPKATCSFCSHALSEHLASESASTSVPTNRTEHAHITMRSNYKPLTLKASANIACSLALGKSTVLLLPSSMDDCKQVMTVLLHRVGDAEELELCLVMHNFRAIAARMETDKQSSSRVDDHQHNGEGICVQSLVNNGEGKEEQVPSNDIKMDDKSSTKGKKPIKRGTKRTSSEDKSTVPPESKRRSLRIAEMKKKRDEEKAKFYTVDEKWVKKHRGKKSKIEALLERKGCSEMEIEHDNVTLSLSDSEVKYLSSNAVEFVQSLSNNASFRTCGKLPSNISSESHVIVATHQVQIHCSQKEEEEEKEKEKEEEKDQSPLLSSSSQRQQHQLPVVLVAVASEDSSTVYTAPLPPDNTQTSLLWTPLSSSVSPSTKMSSLSWTEAAEDTPYDAFLCAGSSLGGLYVWRFKLQCTSSLYSDSFEFSYKEVQLVDRNDSEHTKDQITSCAWSPDKKSLVAGTICGEILVYSADLEVSPGQSVSVMQPFSGSVLKHMQTLPVCGGSVQCLAWSKDSRLLAVGGSDDNVQILQSREPKTTTKPIAPSSILNYFKRDDSETRHKFVHTHTLRGHQSFIADLCFLGGSHRLVSIGWDSQLLIWNHLLLPSLPKISSSSSSRAVHHNTQHTEQSAIAALPLTEVEPVEGFKLGPSASVEFLPLAVYNFLDFGLFVLVRNRMGAVYVVLYMRSL